MKVLFIDRDGTLIEEPPSEQIDRVEQIRFMPGVFAALAALRTAGYEFAMVTNQDGLGTESLPQSAFDACQSFIVEAFASQGIPFEAVFVCPHFPGEGCACRKPGIALVTPWIAERGPDLAASAMIGDRDTDLEFARNLGIRGLRVRRHGAPGETWPALVRELLARRAVVTRETKETRIRVAVDLDAAAQVTAAGTAAGFGVRAATGIGFFDHMLEQLGKHGGFALELDCSGDLHIDEHHTIEDCALALGAALRQALGSKAGIQRYGFLLPMDEAEAQVAIDLSGRPYAVFEGRFGRDQVGGLPTELVPHFFRSLGESLGAAIHVSVRGENTHHMIEASFKGVGRALRAAFRREGSDLPTTKGIL